MWDPRAHARRGDPSTSHQAAAQVNVSDQARRVLFAYASGQALLDVEAYRRAGYTSASGLHQRCSDLRQAGLIERTGQKAQTPSGRLGYLCRITEVGLIYLGLVR